MIHTKAIEHNVIILRLTLLIMNNKINYSLLIILILIK